MKKVYSNLPVDDTASTTDVFENYFASDAYVSENQFSAIVAFFERRAENKTAAMMIAVSVVTVARATGQNVMEIMDQFRAVPNNQLDHYLAYFMNLNRVPTSAIGIQNAPVANKYVTRAILP